MVSYHCIFFVTFHSLQLSLDREKAFTLVKSMKLLSDGIIFYILYTLCKKYVSFPCLLQLPYPDPALHAECQHSCKQKGLSKQLFLKELSSLCNKINCRLVSGSGRCSVGIHLLFIHLLGKLKSHQKLVSSLMWWGETIYSRLETNKNIPLHIFWFFFSLSAFYWTIFSVNNKFQT